MDSTLLQNALNSFPQGDIAVVRYGYMAGIRGNITAPRISYSVSKSLTASVAGRLLQTGHIQLTNQVPNSAFPTLPAATYRDFLRMTSDYGLYPHQPGSYYAYNNKAVHHMAGALDDFYPGQSPTQVLDSAIFNYIGRQDALQYQGLWSGWGGGFSISTRDCARLGLLVARQGAWQSQQVLKQTFVNDLYFNQIPAGAQPNLDDGSPPTEGPSGNNWWNQDHLTAILPGNYSFGWWTNQNSRYPTIPKQVIWANGLGGHFIIAVPSQDLVISATSMGNSIEVDDLLQPVLDSIIDSILRPDDQEGTPGTVSGELNTWHRVSVSFEGPPSDELAAVNPFLDYRMDVTFKKGGREIVVPGFYAADGDAAETGASSGRIWRVNFMPDEAGWWYYDVSFRQGPGVSIDANPLAGLAGVLDGVRGRFKVNETDKSGDDFRGKGLLEYVGKRYLQFKGSGDYFLKGGADSPENFLAYTGFDHTLPTHQYDPHANDWQTGDPDWQGGRGRRIIGALNYVAEAGVNAVYFLTMNVQGDGNDVWPWTGNAERYRYDCSKLDQWEIVFEHMDRLGIQLHVVTQETENDQLLDGGQLGPSRKLYYRELVARFAHHPALQWNLGEENTNTDAQRKQFAQHLLDLDPYDHPIVVHTPPFNLDQIYTPLLGDNRFHGASLQVANLFDSAAETAKWVANSAGAGHPWVVTVDEIGPANVGVVPDATSPNHDEVRREVLWSNLLAGGAGAEWYFGYAYPNDDLDCEDWRSRDSMWRQTDYALELFQSALPFEEMEPADQLVTNSTAACLAKPGEIYLIYMKAGGSTWLNLEGHQGTYALEWYNPRNGTFATELIGMTVTGPGLQFVPDAPWQPTNDWAVVVRRIDTGVLLYGPGLAGQQGKIPDFSAGVPYAGNDRFRVDVGNALPNTTAMLLVGDAPAAVPMYGGTQLNNASLGIFALTTDAQGVASYSMPLAPDPGLVGMKTYYQWLIWDSAAPMGVAMSRGLQVTILR